jgi:hypothetical protein
MSEEDLDRDAVLMRAYGKGTSIIIDRESELTLCMAPV